MKKFYSFLLTAIMTLVSGNLLATDVATLVDLQSALAAGGDITLTADITTSTTLQITQATHIDGRGFCIKGTAATVLEVATDEVVAFDDIIIYAAKEKEGVGILCETNNANITLNNVTINSTIRGMNVWDADGVELTINTSKFNLITSAVAPDAKGNPTLESQYDINAWNVSSSYSRGLNIGSLTNTNITLNNTTIQGFFYNVNNIGGTMEGTTIIANECTFKGRAALNIWGQGSAANPTTWIVNDAMVTGINNWGGAQESFACFVLNNGSTNHNLTINGGTLVAASFNSTGLANPNARQFLIRDMGTDNVITINNAQFTCTKEADNEGNSKGGILEYIDPSSTITVNGGIYDCPEILEGTWKDGEGNSATIVINGGTFDINVVSANLDGNEEEELEEAYSAIEINAGNFEVKEGSITATDPEDASNTLLGANMTSVSNVDGSVTVMNTTVATSIEPVEEDKEVETTEEQYQVQVATGKTLTVKDGATLVIGRGGIVMQDNTASIVVENGGTLVLNGDVNGNGDASSLVIETQEGAQTAFVIDPDVNVYGDEHPQGTFKLTSKAYNAGSKYIWQRFGIPTYDGQTTITWENNTRTYIHEYMNSSKGWNRLVEGGNSTGTWTLENKNAFTCFNMTSEAAAAGDVYTFTGNLTGNQNAQLNFVSNGFNFYANSYTAPIDIEQMLNDVLDNYGDNVSATAYIYRPADNWWDEVNVGKYELKALGLLEEDIPTTIAPMQAFVLQLYNGTSATTEIDYRTNVYNPAAGIANSAPARRSANNNISAAVAMTISNAQFTDQMTLVEGINFSDAFDNGYDAYKFQNGEQFNLYASTNDGDFGTLATNSLEDARLAFNAAYNGTYTITFSSAKGAERYALKDMLTGQTVNIVAGQTYTFTAEQGVNDARFTIVARAEAPTAIDNISTNAKKAGIYTLQGQFVGETGELSTLPQGVYVVDGKKVIR